MGSNRTGGMDVCLLRVLCVVRERYLRRADHSSRGMLTNVCVCVTECDQMLQSPSTSTRVGGNIVSGVVPLGNVSWMSFQEGRSSKLRSRQGVRRLLALVVNPVASILEFNVCEQSELQEDKDSGARS